MIKTWRLAALALALSMAAAAERAFGEGIHSLEAGAEYYSFDYREDLPAGRKSTESAWIPGVYCAYAYHGIDNPLYLSASLCYSYVRTNYSGTTQGGVPISDNTRNVFSDTRVLAGPIALRPTTSYLWLVPLIGGGYHYWYRSLGEGDSYTEIYTWYYFATGLRAEFFAGSEVTFGIEATYMKMMFGEITIYLSELNPGFNDPKSDLGNRYGVRATAFARYRIGLYWAVTASAWYERSEIGRGEDFDVTFNGAHYGTGYEPASESRRYGGMMSVQLLF